MIFLRIVLFLVVGAWLGYEIYSLVRMIKEKRKLKHEQKEKKID